MEKIINGPETLENALQGLKALNLDKPWRMTVKPYVRRRSDIQHRLMWLWLGIIEADTGNTKEDMHLYFKIKFLGTEERSVLGETITEIKSTTVLNIKEFTEYLDKIERFTAETIGIPLSHPEILYWEAMGI